MSVQLALDGMSPSIPFLDLDVAQALAQFPAAKGIHQLQPLPDSDPSAGDRDGIIVWELLQGARRLMLALQSNAPYVDLKVSGGLS